VRRFVFAPRWVLGHVVVLIAAGTCLLLSNWQWDVSHVTHSLQNMAYALQWPLFAVFFLVAWWRMLVLESRRLDEEQDEPGDPAGPEHGADDSGQVPAGVGSAQPKRCGVRRRSKPPVDRPLLYPPVPSAVAAQSAASAEHAPSDQHAPDDGDGADGAEDAALAAYNRMLAELALRDQQG
jgi:hypothetical protein